MTTITITAGELAKIYARKETYFFCDMLSLMKPGYRPVSSLQVIEQFVKAKPDRFYQDTLARCEAREAFSTVSSPMKMKYYKQGNPRLNLLKAIPPDYVLEFQMEKITNKG
jgi:hypothetical protein